MELRIKRIDAELPLPEYAHDGDAGFDLYAREEVTLNSLERAVVPTGIALEIPDGYVGLIWDRSGLSTKRGIKTLGGVVDAGYRGEIKVGLVNVNALQVTIERGERIAQMIIQERVHATLTEVDNLSETKRGDGGFGSSGK